MPAETVVRDSFAAQGALRLLGAEMVSVGDGRCTIALDHRADLTQQDGFFHAGVLTTIADSAGGYAAYSLMPEGSSVLATEFKFNFLRPATPGRAVAEARVVKAGRTLTVSAIDVYVEGDAGRSHVATGTQTCMCLQGSDRSGEVPLEE